MCKQLCGLWTVSRDILWHFINHSKICFLFHREWKLFLLTSCLLDNWFNYCFQAPPPKLLCFVKRTIVIEFITERHSESFFVSISKRPQKFNLIRPRNNFLWHATKSMMILRMKIFQIELISDENFVPIISCDRTSVDWWIYDGRKRKNFCFNSIRESSERREWKENLRKYFQK